MGVPGSSARTHLQREDDQVVVVEPLLQLQPDWQGFPSVGLAEDEARTLWQHEWTGGPAGSSGFVAALEALTGRRLHRQKPGPKRSQGTR